MGLYVGNLPIGRVWQGDTIIRAVAQGNQMFWPEGAGAVLNSSRKLGDCSISGALYRWTHDASLVYYPLHEGSPYLTLSGAVDGSRYIPYIRTNQAVTNVAIEDVFCTMYSPVAANWRWALVVVNGGQSTFYRATGSLSAGQTILDQPLYASGNIFNTGPLGNGALIYMACFDSTYSNSNQIVVSNFSFKATATV